MWRRQLDDARMPAAQGTMSGRAGMRGYLLQTIICLLDALQKDGEWESLTLEPDLDSAKVDIVWYSAEPNRVRATQVKSSQNQINVPQTKRWAKELEDSIQATKYELILLGPCSQGVVDLKRVGKVDIPSPRHLRAGDMIEQAAHRLDWYLEDLRYPKLPPAVREMLASSLVTKLETFSTSSQPVSREDFNDLLSQWLSASYPNTANAAGPLARAASATPSVDAQSPRLTLKILRPDRRKYADEITFVQPQDTSPFRFRVALVNTEETAVATEIDITIRIYWDGGTEPKLRPRFRGPADKEWEYYHDRITRSDAAVFRFRGSERDRCTSRQPLEWDFSLELREKLIGDFLLCYVVSCSQVTTEITGRLVIHMG